MIFKQEERNEFFVRFYLACMYCRIPNAGGHSRLRWSLNPCSGNAATVLRAHIALAYGVNLAYDHEYRCSRESSCQLVVFEKKSSQSPMAISGLTAIQTSALCIPVCAVLRHRSLLLAGTRCAMGESQRLRGWVVSSRVRTRCIAT